MARNSIRSCLRCNLGRTFKTHESFRTMQHAHNCISRNRRSVRVSFHAAEELHIEDDELNEYRERIYRLARKVPAGRVMTYGQIAELLDSDESRYTAQTVGWAMHALGDTDCWARVINARGACSTGKVMLPGNKQQCILEREGVVFNERGCCDLKLYLWIPAAEDLD